MASPTSFPEGARVTLEGLSKADFNGLTGTVRSSFSESTCRQEVFVDDLSKTVALKPSNLRYVPRPPSGLSVREMKIVLKQIEGGPDERELVGMDRSQLAKVVGESATPEEIAAVLAEAAAPPRAAATAASPPAGGGPGADQLKAGADQLANMNPETLRQQARALRAMSPAAVRASNPQMAGFSDAQIRAAADQMESMASNPAMMKMAAEQVRNMSGEDMEKMRTTIASGGGGGGGAVTAAETGAPAGYGTRVGGAAGGGPAAASQMPVGMTEAQLHSQSEQLKKLSPDELRQQAQMLKTMDPATLRRMNPQMAAMSDDQIKMAAQQFETMAENPEMVKMAADQMKNMSPKDMESLQRLQENMGGAGMGAADGANLANMDASKLLETMDAKKIKESFDIFKKNPELIKKMMAGNPAAAAISEDQMMKGLEMFDKMDEKQIDSAMKWVKRGQKVYSPIAKSWSKANGLVGGQLGKLLGFGILFVLVRWVFSYFSLGAAESGMGSGDMGALAPEESVPLVGSQSSQDEFAEF